MTEIIRCGWAAHADPIYSRYHDEEWGVPVHEDIRHYEFLVLDGMQAGISWYIVLKKREAFRAAFDHFDPVKVAQYGPEKIEELMQNAGIVRNRQKINAAVTNAKAFLKVQEEFGTFDRYIWGFVGGKTLVNHWTSMKEVPALSPEAQAMSKDLLKRGFKFVGPTICYAYMQAAGLVNDHTVDCFRYKEV
ncbi:MAG: DNA-3-methyladenine glycosylase I [Anaerolineae bacterium]